MIRLFNRTTENHPVLKTVAVALIVIVLAAAGGNYIGARGIPAFSSLMQLLVLGLMMVVIMARPHFGVIAIVASLPLTLVLPGSPLFTSLLIPLGLATFGAYLLQRRWGNETGRISWHWVHIFALLFVGWLFVSNPNAAVLGGRNWLFTYGQLIMLMFLAGVLLQSRKRQQQALLIFSLAAALSAFVALASSPLLQDTGASLREQRAEGLAGINNGARYYVVALVALYYLRTTTPRFTLRLLALAGMILMVLGVLATGSRSAFFLLPAALVLIVANRRAGGLSGRLTLVIVVVVFLISIVPDSYWQYLESSVNLNLVASNGEQDIRVRLWQAAVQMWRDHPLIGVGIGRFAQNLPAYDPIFFGIELGPHSIYFGLLAETGIVGLFLFMAVCGASFNALWQASHELPQADAALAFTWLAILLIMLLGGLTKHDQYEKLIWFAFGMSAWYAEVLARQQPATVEIREQAEVEVQI